MKRAICFLLGIAWWCCFWWFLAFHASVWSFVLWMTIEAALSTAALLWLVFLHPWPAKAKPHGPKFRHLSLMLAALMAWGACYEASSKSTLTNAPPATPKPQLVAQCGVALGLLAAGVVIAIGLKKMCAKLNPPPEPLPPPPIPLIFLGPWPMVRSLPMIAGQSPIQINFDDSGVVEYDISTNGWTDPQGYPYYAFFKTTLQSSTGNGWTNECSVLGYCSYLNVTTLWLDSHGNPYLTNCCAKGVGGTSSNMCNIYTTGSTKFFRLMSPP